MQCWFYEHFPDQFPLLETAAPAFPCMTKWAPLARAQTLPPNCFNAIGSQLDTLKRQQVHKLVFTVFLLFPLFIALQFIFCHSISSWLIHIAKVISRLYLKQFMLHFYVPIASSFGVPMSLNGIWVRGCGLSSGRISVFHVILR